MIVEDEKEVKFLLNKQQHDQLIQGEEKIKNLFKKHRLKDIIISNSIDIYYDDIKRSIKKSNSVLRIRKTELKTFLTLKQKEKEGHSVERTIVLTAEQCDNFLDDYKIIMKQFELKINDLLEIAKFEVKRKSLIFEDFRIDLDNVVFSDNEDYEIEIEDIGLEQAMYKINELKKEFNLTLKQSKPKIARYFAQLDDTSNQEVLDIKDIIVVVEGRSDTNKLKSIFKDINTFETSGLGLTKQRVEELKNISISNNKKIVVLTDPDAPGEIIRNTIKKEIPNTYHIHVPKSKAKSSKKIGIEHCKKDDLKDIFKDIKQYNPNDNFYKMEDLIELGIYQDKEKRRDFCDKYNISFGNNKKVLKQLNTYNIKIDFLKVPH